METQDQIHCPKCGSSQITANKKGFSGGKAAAGAVLTGGIGLLAGTIGSKKIVITCLNCGKQFKPGEGVRKVNVNAGISATKPTLQPKLVWDGDQKKHVINPNYTAPQKQPQSNSSLLVASIIVFVLFIIILRACTA